MASARKTAVFLDTSIQIARQVHDSQTKAAIKKRLSLHARHAASLVVRQEFKHRLSHFLTLNSTESQHFCRVLGQTMVVQPVDPKKEEIVCKAEDTVWPEFGAKQVAK